MKTYLGESEDDCLRCQSEGLRAAWLASRRSSASPFGSNALCIIPSFKENEFYVTKAIKKFGA